MRPCQLTLVRWVKTVIGSNFAITMNGRTLFLSFRNDAIIDCAANGDVSVAFDGKKIEGFVLDSGVAFRNDESQFIADFAFYVLPKELRDFCDWVGHRASMRVVSHNETLTLHLSENRRIFAKLDNGVQITAFIGDAIDSQNTWLGGDVFSCSEADVGKFLAFFFTYETRRSHK
jgi:hypothetical protein